MVGLCNVLYAYASGNCMKFLLDKCKEKTSIRGFYGLIGWLHGS